MHNMVLWNKHKQVEYKPTIRMVDRRGQGNKVEYSLIFRGKYNYCFFLHMTDMYFKNSNKGLKRGHTYCKSTSMKTFLLLFFVVLLSIVVIDGRRSSWERMPSHPQAGMERTRARMLRGNPWTNISSEGILLSFSLSLII